MNEFITLRRIAVVVVAEATLKIIIIMIIIIIKSIYGAVGRDKIQGDVEISDYSDGGLKMIDLTSFNKALKSIWIKKYLQI